MHSPAPLTIPAITDTLRSLRGLGRLALLVPLLASASIACGGTEPQDDTTVDDAELQQGATVVLEGKLYSDPYATPDATCDVHTAMKVVKARSGKLRLELENKVHGPCELFVEPDKRTYGVTESTACGSISYSNSRGVWLQDNRTRLCEDARPAVLELEEKRNGQVIRLYGEPSATQTPPVPATPAAAVLDVKLYDQPDAQVTPSCDVYTHLAVTPTGSGLSARFENKLSATSMCEPFIAPNVALFDVTTSDDCGSKVYSGTSSRGTVTITDNSTRLCENVVAARVVVAATIDGHQWNLYSVGFE